MVGSMIIGANGIEETMEAARVSPVQIAPIMVIASLTLTIR
jgi:hypothetical protein